MKNEKQLKQSQVGIGKDGLPRWLNEKEVSSITDRAVQSLRNDRCLGRGLPYYKLGRKVVYSIKDIFEYMEAHRISTRVDK